MKMNRGIGIVDTKNKTPTDPHPALAIITSGHCLVNIQISRTPLHRKLHNLIAVLALLVCMVGHEIHCG